MHPSNTYNAVPGTDNHYRVRPIILLLMNGDLEWQTMLLEMHFDPGPEENPVSTTMSKSGL